MHKSVSEDAQRELQRYEALYRTSPEPDELDSACLSTFAGSTGFDFAASAPGAGVESIFFHPFKADPPNSFPLPVVDEIDELAPNAGKSSEEKAASERREVGAAEIERGLRIAASCCCCVIWAKVDVLGDVGRVLGEERGSP
jgi:hypothetical protein